MKFLAPLAALILSAAPTSAQWETTTHSLKGGWNAIHLTGDARQDTLDNLLPAAVMEVWRWNPNPTQVQFTQSPLLPSAGTPEWSARKRGQPAESTLSQLTGQASYGAASVTLHDPTREKTVALDAPAVGLAKLPATVSTTDYQGKTYFQNLPPNLQQRVYLDPLRGPKGTLVFAGEFHDEPAGEDYIDLNVLSAADTAALQDLTDSGDPDKAKWDAAIAALSTRVETFKENASLAGTYIVDPAKTVTVDVGSPATISDHDTAVDSYALTATGKGEGYVTMVFGNGDAFTDPGDPVEVKVFKVTPQLYTGDLKVVDSRNPLDEQVALRHSGDFAGHPEDYEFEWRWTTGAASAPAVYTTNMTTRIGDSSWQVVTDPGAALPTAVQYADAPTLSLPRSAGVHPATYTAEEKSAAFPALAMRSAAGVNFTGGVPGDIVFSATTGDLDGFVLYINGTAAIAWQAPAAFVSTNPASGLTPGGLPRQFRVDPAYFSVGNNTVEIGIYSSADPGTNSLVNFHLDAAQETDAVANGSTWQTPSDPTAEIPISPSSAARRKLHSAARSSC